MTASSRSTVGLIGIGAMGSAFARHLLHSGYAVVGYDLSEERRAQFIEMGGLVVSPREMSGMCDIAILSLPSGEAAREVLRPESPVGLSDIDGWVLIETSTLSVEDKLDLGELARARGATLLDCPVSGTSEQAQNGDLIAYVSGEDGAKARAVPVVAAFTRRQFDVGGIGDGTKVKLVANLLVAIHNVAAAEALALARGAGLDLTATLAAVADGAGSSRMLQVRGPRMIDEDYLPATMRVALFQKDIGLIRDLQASLGLQAPLLEAAAGVYAEAEGLGFGDLDTASVFTVLKQQARP